MPCKKHLQVFYPNTLTENGTPLYINYVNSRKLNNNKLPVNKKLLTIIESLRHENYYLKGLFMRFTILTDH